MTTQTEKALPEWPHWDCQYTDKRLDELIGILDRNSHRYWEIISYLRELQRIRALQSIPETRCRALLRYVRHDENCDCHWPADPGDNPLGEVVSCECSCELQSLLDRLQIPPEGRE
jgi:hypothetical protein